MPESKDLNTPMTNIRFGVIINLLIERKLIDQKSADQLKGLTTSGDPTEGTTALFDRLEALLHVAPPGRRL